jgi:hypothetical protein
MGIDILFLDSRFISLKRVFKNYFLKIADNEVEIVDIPNDIDKKISTGRKICLSLE